MKARSLDQKLIEKDSENCSVVTRTTTRHEEATKYCKNRKENSLTFHCDSLVESQSSSYPSEKTTGQMMNAAGISLQYRDNESWTSTPPLQIQKTVESIEEDNALHSERHKYNASTWEMYNRITSARMKKSSQTASSTLNYLCGDNENKIMAGCPLRQQQQSGGVVGEQPPSTSSCTQDHEPFDLDY